MVVDPMIVAGIGCRRGVTTLEVDAAIQAALAASVSHAHDLKAIAIPCVKSGETGVVSAARARGVELTLVTAEALLAANARTRTRSARSLAALGVHSVAEASALAAAGPAASLLGPRTCVGPVTCALARVAPAV
jgi:cobalt-precorrin 5A hydrolase